MDLIGLLPIFVAFSVCYGEKYTRRKIHREFPDIKCDNITMPILHVTATNEENAKDVIHYVFSTVDNPTIIIKHVLEPTELKLNISNICNRRGDIVSFTGEDSHLSGLIISKVFAYDDVRDDIFLHQDTSIGSDIVHNFIWSYDEKSDEKIKFKGNHRNGTMEFSLRMHDRSGNGHDPPRNPINANLTEFRLEMSNLPINYKHTRYAVEVMFFSTGGTTSDATHTTSQYIDDEYTPGIFEIWAVKFLTKLPIFKQTYVTWKPVSYHSPVMIRSAQGLVKKFSEQNGVPVNSLKNPIKRYAGDVPWTLIHSSPNLQYYAINVTFGLPKDGFFNANNYLSWSGMVGSGIPPKDTMSSTTILVLAIGLGSPAVVMLAGLIFILIRRMQQSGETNYNEIH